MKIGDEVFVHGYVDEIRKDTIIIKNKGGYFGTDESELIVRAWQTQPPKENGMYFVTTEKGGKRSVTMSGYRDEWIVEGVVAWMTIPSAYQGE